VTKKTGLSLQAAQEKAASPRIRALDTSALSKQDVLNLILQRSEIIEDQPKPGAYIKAWTRGEAGPLLQLIDEIGPDELIQRAAAFILLEYEELYPVLADNPPSTVTDIGCGYAFFDLFLAQDFDCNLTLIDLEQSEERHFGFEENGAAYSDLAITKAFLRANGIAAKRIKTINPETQSVARIKDQELVVSFISCGFHYPWSTYAEFFEKAVKPGGKIILDVRRRTLQATLDEMSSLGSIRELDAGASPKAARIVVTRAAN
jgi:SAM-dependent methyltransferase